MNKKKPDKHYKLTEGRYNVLVSEREKHKKELKKTTSVPLKYRQKNK